MEVISYNEPNALGVNAFKKATNAKRSVELEELTEPLSRKNTNVGISLKTGLIILSLLYLMQGVPVGLCMGALPYIAKPKLAYSDLALITLSSYPYSLKLLWSPIVDTFYFKKFGRRKSWIVPVQIIAGSLMILYAGSVQFWVDNAQNNVRKLSIAMFALVLLFSTQDIAVDGWALTLLPESHRHLGSTVQSIFINVGFFLSFTVFIALNSIDFSNKYIFSTPKMYPLLSLELYLRLTGLALVFFSIYLILFIKESSPKRKEIVSISSAYNEAINIFKLPSIKLYLVIMAICKAPFITSEELGSLSIAEKLPKEYTSLIYLIDFPVQITASYLCAVMSSKLGPINVWIKSYYLRILMIPVSISLFHLSSRIHPASFPFFYLLIFEIIFTSLGRTLQFSSAGSFFNSISDESIGGTYMTLLNTASNLGGTWPKFFIMKAVDYLTTSYCTNEPNVKCLQQGLTKVKVLNGNDTYVTPETCGPCKIVNNGYYTSAYASICLAIIFIYVYAPKLKYLSTLPSSAWKVGKSDKKL